MTRREETPSEAGFVVDNKPDLRVSRVLPWLLLGRWAFLSMIVYILSSSSQDVAADHALLEREGVTHILNVATGIEIDRGDSGVVEERVELLDIPEQCILQSSSFCLT